MFDEEVECKTAKEFIDCFLNENILEPKDIFDISERITADFIFRGQSNSIWSLKPTAFREKPKFEDYTPQPPSSKKDDIFEFIDRHNHAEIRSVHLFLEAADKIGIKTPLDYNVFKTDDFNLRRNTEVNGISPFPPNEYFSAMALAQHHGIPTRFMDWTYSPFVAAYFAAINGADEHKVDPNSELAIYCLCTRLLNDLPSIEIVSVPFSENEYLRAQRGVFLLMKNANEYFMENQAWPSIEDIIRKERVVGKDYMRAATIKITLPTSESKELLRLLYRLDISELTMMPSLSNAAKSFNYKRVLFS